MNKIFYKVVICLTCLILLTPHIHVQAETGKATTVKAILEEMDKRMNKDALQKVEMEVYEDKKVTKYLCTIKSKNNNQFLLLRYLSPERWKDTNLLMVGQEVVIYDSHSDRFLEVPKNLAFGGTDIAHGDMMRLNLSKNYDGEILSEDKTAWTVSLSTTNKAMPYFRIEIVINKAGYYPVTAKCFTKSNKQIKTIEYTELKELNGIVKPTKYTFLSPYEPDKYNIIRIMDEKLIEYPDYIFNKFALRSGIDKQF